MRVIGLDFGEKTVGVAVSDLLGIAASGVEVIRRKDKDNLKQTVERINELLIQYETKTIVLGYPRHLNGDEGEKCQAVLYFKERLRKQIKGVTIELWDERLSTVAANRALLEADLSRAKRKSVIDKMAAVYILQGYLDKISYNNNKNNNIFKEEHMADNKDGFEEDFEDEEYEYETITMTDEDGTSVEYIISDTVEMDGNTYIVVLDAEDDLDSEEADAYIFKQVGEEGEEFVYEEVSEEEFEKVAQKLAELSDEYNIEEE